MKIEKKIAGSVLVGDQIVAKSENGRITSRRVEEVEHRGDGRVSIGVKAGRGISYQLFAPQEVVQIGRFSKPKGQGWRAASEIDVRKELDA